jgi:putative transposase
VEANPLRAGLVERAEEWRWSSLGAGDADNPLPLARWPVNKPRQWNALVNEPMDDVALKRLRQSVWRGTPYGEQDWADQTARRLNITSTMRSIGRPRKPKNQ